MGGSVLTLAQSTLSPTSSYSAAYEITFTISLILVFGSDSSSPLLSHNVINVTQASDMSDAPVTQDTVTAGNDRDDEVIMMTIMINLTIFQTQKMLQLLLKL